MTTQRIVLIRHAMPQIEEGVPSAQWQLSADGAKAAAALAANFRDFEFANIVSSPEPKAVGTAEALAAQLGLAVELDSGFAEHARHSLGYLPRDEMEAGIARLFASHGELVFGDETADQLYARFAAALARQQAKGARDIFAVTHGTILTIYLSRTLGIDPLPFWQALATPAAVIVESGQHRIVQPGPKNAPFAP